MEAHASRSLYVGETKVSYRLFSLRASSQTKLCAVVRVSLPLWTTCDAFSVVLCSRSSGSLFPSSPSLGFYPTITPVLESTLILPLCQSGVLDDTNGGQSPMPKAVLHN